MTLPPLDPDDAGLLAAGRAALGPGFRVRALARVGSTQDAVRAAARAGAPAGECCVAEEQAAGRGRQGRRWEAPPGSALLVSILLRPEGPAGLVPLAAGLAVVEAVRSTTGIEARVRWPNDVLAPQGGKLAGLLAEVEPAAPPVRRQGGAAPAVVLGIGLNVQMDAFPPGADGASLHALLAPEPPPRRERLLAAVVTALGRRLEQLGRGDDAAAELRGDWEAAAVGLGAAVRVDTPEGPLHGTALGLAADGALRVREQGGAERLLVAGDVHIVEGGGR